MALSSALLVAMAMSGQACASAMATNAPQMHDSEAIALTVADWLRRRRARAAGQSGGLAAARIVSDMMRNRRARRVIVREAQK